MERVAFGPVLSGNVGCEPPPAYCRIDKVSRPVPLISRGLSGGTSLSRVLLYMLKVVSLLEDSAFLLVMKVPIKLAVLSF